MGQGSGVRGLGYGVRGLGEKVDELSIVKGHGVWEEAGSRDHGCCFLESEEGLRLRSRRRDENVIVRLGPGKGMGLGNRRGQGNEWVEGVGTNRVGGRVRGYLRETYRPGRVGGDGALVLLAQVGVGPEQDGQDQAQGQKGREERRQQLQG